MKTDLTLEAQLQACAAAFQQRFNRTPTLAAVAPGRVNLIGEHTDYNAGFVLPIAIERQTVVVAAPRDDRKVQLASMQADAEATFEFAGHTGVADDPAAGITRGQPSWANYVKGVFAGFARLRDDALNDARDDEVQTEATHITIPGVDVMFASNVPLGGGLSSSASLEVATATLLEAATGMTLKPTAKALLCQQAEHEFAGVPCGIMDQFISVFGQADHAMLLDCRSQAVTQAPLNDPDVAVLVIDCGVRHELTGGEYAQRRKQCEQAAKTMNVAALRDADEAMLVKHADQLDDLTRRRATHVVTEIHRTLAAADALKSHDWTTMGQLMYASHASLRDDFEVSCDELNALVQLAEQLGETRGVWGSRMTGGGFGGCTVTLVAAAEAERVSGDICEAYFAKTNTRPAAFLTRAAAGARVITL